MSVMGMYPTTHHVDGWKASTGVGPNAKDYYAQHQANVPMNERTGKPVTTAAI
jgi:hypothetical protein